MSHPESGSGFSIEHSSGQAQTINQDESSQGHKNERISVDILTDGIKTDISNGFDAHSNQTRSQQVSSSTDEQGGKQEQQQSSGLIQIQQSHHHQQQQQPNQLHPHQHAEDQRSASVPVLPTHAPYHDNIVIDRVQYVSQGPGQAMPIGMTPEYLIIDPTDSLQYLQIPKYVNRDGGFRDPVLYTPNITLSAGQGSYVQQQPPQSQIPAQSTNSQPTAYYTTKGLGLPPPVATGYVHFAPQIHYGQYPQTAMNATPYNSQKVMYPPPYSQLPPQQTSSAQHSPNPPRFSQEFSQYQSQPIIQPIAQNIGHTGPACNNERISRGPKPIVPPRINSKITHDAGHRKSTNIDVSAIQKSKAEEGNNSEGQPSQDSQNQQVHSGQDNQDRRFIVTTVSQNPRTRQDGLYVETNGDSSREQIASSDVGKADCGIYVSRSDHRKLVSDANSSFHRRNDTITFTFPDDVNTQQDPMLLVARKPVVSTNIGDNNPMEVNTTNFPSEQRRLDVNTTLRMSPMPILPPLALVPKGILVTGERKSVEWSNLNPNQRISIPQENRRSDYFEEHRRSPMTVDTKRYEDIRRSPMAFVPIQDPNPAERMNQKSPNNMVNQNFEKTREELAMWAEQRQRQEIENRMLPNREIFTAGARSRNPSEERRPDGNRNYGKLDKEARMSLPQSAFQPTANISQNSIMEQRRHLRHVSADLTKHIELTRKELDDQQIAGSVLNLGTTPALTSTNNAISQRASPNICYQYPAPSEAKVDAKMSVNVLTDDPPAKPLEHVDHIIHSHRKSQNSLTNALSFPKNQENIQSDQTNDKADSQQTQCQQILHNKQSIDFISEKLSQCERQQSDLQAKLQSLQNQNEILDKVAQFQYQQSDLQARMHNLQLQNQLAEKLGQKQNSEFLQSSCQSDQDQTNKSILNQCINASRQLYQQSLLTTVTPQIQATNYLTSERVSPRLQFQQQAQEDPEISDSIQIPNISQIPLPSLSQFDGTDILSRGTFSQLQRVKSSNDNLDNIPCSQMNLASLSTQNFTGTLKKVPPEKPPRTSLIVQSPDTESNRSQPAIGLKHTSKARNYGDIDKIKIDRQTDAISKNITVQPYVIVVGENDYKVDTVYLCIDSIIYTIPSLLRALDICFKSFHIFNAKYTPQSEHIWLLLQLGLYKLKTKWDKEILSVTEVLNDVEHIALPETLH